MKITNHLTDIFYPRICLACGRKLLRYERTICTFCMVELPKTNQYSIIDNAVEKLFWGRCKIHSGAAYYFYLKESRVQELIFNFKYKGYKEIGIYVGEQFGEKLKNTDRFSKTDFIIPVPLHPKKQLKRGFNQSEIFARGLARKMTAEIEIGNLYRKVNSFTQTKKSRWDRYKNVNDIFGIKNHSKLIDKHILIVDDVITTGSTMEACVNLLNKIEGVTVSVLAMASSAH